MIKTLIEKFLKDKHNYVAKNKKFSLNPSVLGDPCLRKKYFSYFKIPQAPKQIPVILTMESGIGIHEMVQGWLGEIGVAIDYLDPATGKPPINFGKEDIEFPIAIPELLIEKGKIDRVVVMNDELWIVEIKSVSSDKFKELVKPAEDHIIQSMVYVFGFEKALKEGKYDHIPNLPKNLDVKGVKILYVNRNTGHMKEFELERNEALFSEICESINEIAQYILKKELPPPPKGGLCQYCPYPEYCKNNRNIE